MSDIQERIAEIIRRSSWSFAAEGDADAIAAVLIHELGLKQEFTWSWPGSLTLSGEPGYGYPVDSIEVARAEGEPYMAIVERAVTPWQPVEVA